LDIRAINVSILISSATTIGTSGNGRDSKCRATVGCGDFASCATSALPGELAAGKVLDARERDEDRPGDSGR